MAVDTTCRSEAGENRQRVPAVDGCNAILAAGPASAIASSRAVSSSADGSATGPTTTADRR
ncbi:hypothetical protein [Mycobacterium sp. NAZ190054]|uniref:hypothetical protein n=1 Tax=Mycobacterium sp. NAZ190054 TaxID=1747766 RepID=UPI0009EA8B51|nr:hypothetical protein [Mycobacterium sp. NAZ190054]